MIADLEPGRLRADPEVGECPTLWVVVEDAEAHAHDIGIGGAPAVDRGAASPAEGAKDARRRLELTEEVGTRGQRPVLPSHVGIRPESGAVRLATTRAVAIDDRAELSRDFDLDRTAEACRVHRLPRSVAAPLSTWTSTSARASGSARVYALSRWPRRSSASMWKRSTSPRASSSKECEWSSNLCTTTRGSSAARPSPACESTARRC